MPGACLVCGGSEDLLHELLQGPKARACWELFRMNLDQNMPTFGVLFHHTLSSKEPGFVSKSVQWLEVYGITKIKIFGKVRLALHIVYFRILWTC